MNTASARTNTFRSDPADTGRPSVAFRSGLSGALARRPRISSLPSAALAAIPQLLQTGPRLLMLLSNAERILARILDLVEEVENTRRQIVLVADRADTAVALAAGVAAEAADVTAAVASLLAAYEPSLRAGQPGSTYLIEHFGRAEADALIIALDRTPGMLNAFEEDVLPVLQTLKTVAPDLTDLLDSSRTLNEMLGGLPGLGRIKKRLDNEADDEADDDAAE